MIKKIFIFLIATAAILAFIPGDVLARSKSMASEYMDDSMTGYGELENVPNFNNPDTRISVPSLKEPKKDLTAVFEFDFFSKYVSKGLPCSKGPVWQPSLALEVYNVGVSIWMNFVLNDEPNQGEFNEIDVLPYYNLNIGNLKFLPAVNFMFGLNSDPESLDYMSHNVIRPQFHISYKLGYFLPYADLFIYVYPTDKFGIYTDFGLLFHHGFNKTISIDTSVQLAVGGKRWNAPRTADVGTQLNNFEYMLSLPFNVIERFTISPVMHVVVTISSSLRQNLEEPDFIWGGLMLKYNI